MPNVLTRLPLACLCVLCLSCPRNPATGARQLNFISQEEEIALGKQGVEEVSETMGLYDDQALQRYVEEVGMKLARVSERPNLPWSFQVVDDAAVNAFALPGGPIFVTRGLLAHLKNEAQLAIVLGHEVGHVTAEHSLNQLSRAKVAQVGIGLGALVSERLAGLGMGGMQLLFLRFGRDDERQSDELALRYASRAGYDVRAAPEVFEVLRRVSQEAGDGRLPDWLSTHPDPAERAETMRARIAKLEPAKLEGARLEEERLMRAIDGMAYGEDPREGIVRGRRFVHPGLRFQVTFPEGFRVVNTKREVIGEQEQGEAAMGIALGEPLDEQTALQRFFAKSGAEPTGAAAPLGEATAAPFRAETEQGMVAGAIAFLERGEHSYRFMVLSAPERAAQFAPGFRALVTSFAPVDDPKLLEAQPARLKVQRAPSQLTLDALHAAHPTVPIDELARLNQLSAGAVIPRGGLVKWIAGSG